MQSADSNTNFKEWLTSGTQTVIPNQQVMVLDDVLTIYRHDHTKKGIYSMMSTWMLLPLQWFAKAQLSTSSRVQWRLRRLRRRLRRRRTTAARTAALPNPRPRCQSPRRLPTD